MDQCLVKLNSTITTVEPGVGGLGGICGDCRDPGLIFQTGNLIDRVIKYGGQFKHIFWNIAADYLFICLFAKLSIKIKFVPYIRYQVSAKAKRKTRAHPGKWGNDWMSLSNESKCSGEQQSTLI